MKIEGIKICSILEIASMEGDPGDIIKITKALAALGIIAFSLVNKEKIKDASEKIINKITKENRLMESNSNQEN